MNNNFKENDLVIYAPTDVRYRTSSDGNIYKFKIGKFKRYNDDNSIGFVYYHSGETASSTPIEYLYPIENFYYIKTCLGTGDDYK